jgi:hypothetical protein
MKANEIFERISPELAVEICRYLQKEQAPVFKTAIQGLANQRRLRPVFIERKPPNERYAWMHAALSRKISETLATHLLQAWLLGAQRQMLCDFLDSLEIAHDDDGTVNDLPASPPREKLDAAVAKLLAKYPAETVAVYLHAFQEMDSSAGWLPLGELLRDEPRLRLDAASPNENS